MLATLIESRRPRTRSVQAQALSLGMHATLIAAAVAATQQAATAIEKNIIEPPPRFVRTVDPAPQPASPSLRLPEFGFRLLPTLIRVPEVLPDIDLTRNLFLTNPDEYLSARGKPGGDPHGVETPHTAMTAEQVDRVAYLLPGTGRPIYPDQLRSAGLSGEVIVQFEIDTAGRADMNSLVVLQSTHAWFTGSVRRALEKARFAPAEFGGRKVRQVVRMPFVFSLERK